MLPPFTGRISTGRRYDWKIRSSWESVVLGLRRDDMKVGIRWVWAMGGGVGRLTIEEANGFDGLGYVEIGWIPPVFTDMCYIL